MSNQAVTKKREPGQFFRTFSESYNPAKLSRQIFEVENPEAFAAALPAQALYMAVQYLGVESAGDLINLATPQQYRAMLDFELWQRDEFAEDNFWNWLQAVDSETDLEPIEKFLAAVDYQLLGLILARHIEHIVFDDANDQLPAPQFYTPDRGYTWVHIKIEDTTRHRQLGKLLAYIFENNGELFYQLLGIPLTTSATALEETSYEEKNLRLREYGIPTREEAWEAQSALHWAKFATSLKETAEQVVTDDDLSDTTPLVIASDEYFEIEKLRDAIIRAGREEQLEAEISHLINTALIVREVSFSDKNEVQRIITFVRDTLNLALEYAEKKSSLDCYSLYHQTGAKDLYRLGLWLLLCVRDLARKAQHRIEKDDITDDVLRFIVSTISQHPSQFPEILAEPVGSLTPRALIEPKIRPFRTLAELETAQKLLRELQS